MLQISRNVGIPDSEISITAVRAQGAGGQNVNKVSSAVHLRFDIHASSLADFYKQRLLKLRDRRITRDGVIIIKAQTYRTQERNRQHAIERLRELIRGVLAVPKTRQATRPTRGSQRRRLAGKTRRGQTKSLRGRVTDDEG